MIDKIRIVGHGVDFFNDKGRLHRLKGPACLNIRSNRIEWLQNGKLHRVSGPAVIQGKTRGMLANDFGWQQHFIHGISILIS